MDSHECSQIKSNQTKETSIELQVDGHSVIKVDVS